MRDSVDLAERGRLGIVRRSRYAGGIVFSTAGKLYVKARADLAAGANTHSIAGTDLAAGANGLDNPVACTFANSIAYIFAYAYRTSDGHISRGYHQDLA